MLFNLSRGAFGKNSVKYTGEYEWKKVGNDWMLAFWTSGTLTLQQSIAMADVCVVAGGQSGLEAELNGGKGGKGGEVKNSTNIRLQSGVYSVVIGGSDQNSSIIGASVNIEAETAGGAPGGGNGHNERSGGEGEPPWNDPDTLLCNGWIFGSGGGRGSYVNDAGWVYTGDAGDGGSVGSASSDTTNGKGGTPSHPNGYNGLANTGQGGGGPRHFYNGSSTGNPGDGGSGVILIRKHKEA